MDQLERIEKMLATHIEKSEQNHLKISTDITEIKTHNTYTKTTLDNHDTSIEKLESAHNKQKGVMWVLSIIGLGGLEELIRNWAK